MKIAVFGAGAIGTFYAARLIQSGHDVAIVARGQTLDALRKRGIRLIGPDGSTHIESVTASDDPTDLGSVDLVIVAVKAWQIPEIAPSIHTLMHDQTAVLPLQNGVEAADQLAATLGARHVLNGMTKVIARTAEPGVVEDLGFHPVIAAGELQNESSSRLEEIEKVFESAGVTFERPADIEATVWEKFLFIASVSGIGAITRTKIGTLRRLPETRALLAQSMTETYRVGLAKGVGFSDTIVDATMQFIDRLPEESTASLQRDIMAGRPSELESQIGAVVRFGDRLEIDTPINRFVYSALLPMELAARGR